MNSLAILQEFFNPDKTKQILEIQNWEEMSCDLDNPETWQVVLIDSPVLSHSEGYFLLKAYEVQSSGDVRSSVIDLSMPERISEMVFTFTDGKLSSKPQYESESEFVPAVSIEGFGVYELFYSKRKPEVGIEVLKKGIKLTDNKSVIAEDLGYILRDEKRLEEAISYFRISAEGNPSSAYIYTELASLYRDIGDKENEKLFMEKYSPYTIQMDNENKPWWKFWG